MKSSVFPSFYRFYRELTLDCLSAPSIPLACTLDIGFPIARLPLFTSTFSKVDPVVVVDPGGNSSRRDKQTGISVLLIPRRYYPPRRWKIVPRDRSVRSRED